MLPCDLTTSMVKKFRMCLIIVFSQWTDSVSEGLPFNFPSDFLTVDRLY